VKCLGLRPAGDFGKSGVEPSDSVTSNTPFCEPLSLLCEALKKMMRSNYEVLTEALYKTWAYFCVLEGLENKQKHPLLCLVPCCEVCHKATVIFTYEQG
jgi:hypothetical protein